MTERGSEDGVSLIELIIAVGLLGAATVTVLGAFGTLVKTSDIGRRDAQVASALSAVAEAVADRTRTPLQPTCTPSYDATPDDVPLPPGITAEIVEPVRYWDPGSGSFQPSCDPARVDLQLVTVRVRATDGRAAQAVSVVKRP